jgi:hypothetical protein
MAVQNFDSTYQGESTCISTVLILDQESGSVKFHPSVGYGSLEENMKVFIIIYQ